MYVFFSLCMRNTPCLRPTIKYKLFLRIALELNKRNNGIHTNVSNFDTASTKIILTLETFMISVILFKMSKHSDFHLIFFQIEGAWQAFTVVTKLIKNFKSLYGLGGRFLKIWDVCMDFEPYFKVHNLVSVHPKSIILGQTINFSMIFHVMVSVYRLVKIWNSP